MLPIPRSLPENVAHIALARHAKASGEVLPVQEPCMSCGSRKGKTGATIKVHCIEGRTERVRVCTACAKERRLA